MKKNEVEKCRISERKRKSRKERGEKETKAESG